MKINRAISSKKFKDIKSYFTISLESNLRAENKLKKYFSHPNIQKRPKLAKIQHKFASKLSNILDQIGKEDVIFKNDKLLITDVKIEPIDSLQKNQIISSNIITEKNFFMSNKTKKINSSLVNLRKTGNKTKKYLKYKLNKSKEVIKNDETFELNCNKMTFNNNMSEISLIKKKINRSKQNSKTIIHKNKFKNKNVERFINKTTTTNNNNNLNNLNINHINKISPIKSTKRDKNSKNYDLHTPQKSLLLKNYSISVLSNSKLGLSKSFIQKKPINFKQSSSLHFPNKSIFKNHENIIIEIQKLFGDKMKLNNESYQNMADLDKINGFNFLLEAIKEMDNIIKINKSKIEGYKQSNEEKEKQNKEQKTEIKGLKKEINNLNKIIKSNLQLNKKLDQNIESLKSQLEKEKQKNKFLLRQKSVKNPKYDIQDTSFNKIRHKKINQEILKKANLFINREKNKNKTNINQNINQNNINVKTSINILYINKEQNKQTRTPKYNEEKYEKD